MPQEVYQQLERLVNFAYQQAGISQLAAGSKKPEGLNSGVALREFDDNQTDRFASLSRAYDTFFVDLAYQVTDKAKEIALRDGSIRRSTLTAMAPKRSTCHPPNSSMTPPSSSALTVVHCQETLPDGRPKWWN
jgi:hypothetical protein